MKLSRLSKGVILSGLLLLFSTAGFSSDYSSSNIKYSLQSSNKDNLKHDKYNRNDKIGYDLLDSESENEDTMEDSYEFGISASQENINGFVKFG